MVRVCSLQPSSFYHLSNYETTNSLFKLLSNTSRSLIFNQQHFPLKLLSHFSRILDAFLHAKMIIIQFWQNFLFLPDPISFTPQLTDVIDFYPSLFILQLNLLYSETFILHIPPAYEEVQNYFTFLLFDEKRLQTWSKILVFRYQKVTDFRSSDMHKAKLL